MVSSTMYSSILSMISFGAVVRLGFAHYFAIFFQIPVQVTAVIVCIMSTTINYFGVIFN
ncbi:MAG: hypothetical protein MUC80_08705 [Candidatus Thermoplasmatota archaeon]|nr:hypothetical protein [Candidatus Thermoplasmatota archaeon]